jgi:outer membrane protein TolC
MRQHRIRRRILLAVMGGALAGAPLAGEEPPVTLDEALALAQAANARLPPAASEREIARQKERETRAQRWAKIALEGGFVYAPPGGYDPALTNGGEGRLQIVGRQPLYDGGENRAAVSKASSQIEVAAARYRIAQRDVELEVQTQFAQWWEARAEIEARRDGLARLGGYRTSLESRRAAGQAVGPDMLKTDVRRASDQSDLAQAEERLAEARLNLNDLMGRDLASPLELAPEPPPSVPGERPADAWAGAPEVAEAAAERESARAELGIARAEAKPHLLATADTGFWTSDTSRPSRFADRFWKSAGFSLGLSLQWPLWDFGAIGARIVQARVAESEAGQKETVESRHARLQFLLARSALDRALREFELLSRAAPDARDAYLEIESRYRGGAASSLEVLEAHATAVDTAIRLAEATRRYRDAEALERRWGAQ